MHGSMNVKKKSRYVPQKRAIHFISAGRISY